MKKVCFLVAAALSLFVAIPSFADNLDLVNNTSATVQFKIRDITNNTTVTKFVEPGKGDSVSYNPTFPGSGLIGETSYVGKANSTGTQCEAKSLYNVRQVTFTATPGANETVTCTRTK